MDAVAQILTVVLGSLAVLCSEAALFMRRGHVIRLCRSVGRPPHHMRGVHLQATL